MTAALAGKSIAILAANGFDENQMTEIQRALAAAKASVKTIAPEQGVVNGWQKDHWGHYFPVDLQIGEALGSDFDFLVIPGGERAIAKLKTNPHTRRIINHFLEAEKPIAAIGAGVELLGLSPKIAGITVSAPSDVQGEITSAGAIISEDTSEICGVILTSNGEDSSDWAQQALNLFAETMADEDQAVAA